MKRIILCVSIIAALAVAGSTAWAARKKEAKASPKAELTEHGKQLEIKYAAMLEALKAEISRNLPSLAEQKKSALQNAQEALKQSTKESSDAAEPLNDVSKAQGLVKHGEWWTGDAKKKKAKAQADLKNATTDAARQAAQKTIDEQQKRYEAGVQALKERQAALETAKAKAATAGGANKTAQAALSQARTNELNAARALLASVEPFLSSDKLDAKLVKATVLTAATPNGLAAFAEKGKEQEAFVDKLLADDKLMKEMLVNGGANYGRYGRTMEIYAAIQNASPKATSDAVLHRLALATALEFAEPVKQSNAKDQANAPEFVDPVKRYLHYEKAYLNGELDPAFKNLSTWEYRMAVDCNAPDEILAWGREMLRTYRPDHIRNPNYGWRYSSAVKTEVPYGSQNVKNDLPSLNEYQNIPKDGGVCGRRAFFGRFILRAFGIPVWGVTQHAHAALSHWTPKGWVVNLGAGFQHSWWDKGEVSVGGSDFLLETQARKHEQDYLKVLRAQWVSRILGEEAYNGRKGITGGIWSSLGHYEAGFIASKEVELGPLGQELGEANESEDKQEVEKTSATKTDQQVSVGKDGKITIPAVALDKANKAGVTMQSFGGGMQLLGRGGFTTKYVFDAPGAGKYALSARIATLQEGQQFSFGINDAPKPVEVPVPYTIGLWQQIPPVEVQLVKGQNALNFAIREGSRAVAIKDFTFTPLK